MNNLWLVRTSASVHFHWVIFEFIHSIDGNAKACHHYSTFACASPVSLHGLHFFWQITTYLASIYVYTYIHIDIIYTYIYIYYIYKPLYWWPGSWKIPYDLRPATKNDWERGWFDVRRRGSWPWCRAWWPEDSEATRHLMWSLKMAPKSLEIRIQFPSYHSKWERHHKMFVRR